MRNIKLILLLLTSSLLSAILSIWFYKESDHQKNLDLVAPGSSKIDDYYQYTNNSSRNISDSELNFVTAAGIVRPAVVHIRSVYEDASYVNPLYDELFREFFRYKQPNQEKSSSGSGVIISSDGYIITNNHVIENSSLIEIVLDDKRRYKADIVGTDITTDIALLKIDEKNLPFAKYGNSNDLKVGEWVLAIGNPFDLNSTVTAGIVSAKNRNINIIRQRGGQYSIEAFIQTDAAVNPGNSGGALINLKGELVGINTAIATNTGAYQGYSFAIPVNLVRKVENDLLKYGEVRRALIGVSIQTLTADIAEQRNIDKIEGVYINDVQAGGAADIGGLKSGDIIIFVDSIKVNSVPELQEQIALHYPGDKVLITYKRDNKIRKTTLALRDKNNNTEPLELSDKAIKIGQLDALLAPASDTDLKNLGIRSGVKIVRLYQGKLHKAGVKEGFIITHIDKKPVKSVEDIKNIIDNSVDGVFISGYYKDGTRYYLGIALD